VSKRQNSHRDEGLGETLLRRLEMADQIHDLTRSQRKAIESGDWDGLKAILNEKDRRIRDFKEAEQSLRRWGSLTEMGEKTPSLRHLISRTESRLVAVQSLEERCRQMLVDKKNQTARTLQEMKQAREALKQFKPHRLKAPRFIDVRR